jgi:Nicotinate phosphoribosyltransferase (NAPRTase) N-terminal domain/Aldehyde dehydrogenase family
MRAVNPVTGELIREYPEHAAAEVEDRVQDAVKALPAWSHRSVRERAGPIRQAATGEWGTPASWPRRWASRWRRRRPRSTSAPACDFFAEHSETLLTDQVVPTEAARSFVRFDPLGAVMPWSFPFWQVFRFAAPALTAGNVTVLKHAANVPGCALAVEDPFRSALFTDLYELTMARAYDAEGMARPATFELAFRKMPAGRNYLVTAGLDDVLTYLEHFRFTDGFAYLGRLGSAPATFMERLKRLRFAGDVDAVEERTVVYTKEPLVWVVEGGRRVGRAISRHDESLPGKPLLRPMMGNDCRPTGSAQRMLAGTRCASRNGCRKSCGGWTGRTRPTW